MPKMLNQELQLLLYLEKAQWRGPQQRIFQENQQFFSSYFLLYRSFSCFATTTPYPSKLYRTILQARTSAYCKFFKKRIISHFEYFVSGFYFFRFKFVGGVARLTPLALPNVVTTPPYCLAESVSPSACATLTSRCCSAALRSNDKNNIA